jgi:hypothetical protein
MPRLRTPSMAAIARIPGFPESRVSRNLGLFHDNTHAFESIRSARVANKYNYLKWYILGTGFYLALHGELKTR